jgi:hypothetical protein
MDCSSADFPFSFRQLGYSSITRKGVCVGMPLSAVTILTGGIWWTDFECTDVANILPPQILAYIGRAIAVVAIVS